MNEQQQEVITISQPEIVGMIDRAEIDTQVSTAKKYPRQLSTVLNNISTYATMTPETAEDCFYVLRRGGNVIEGLSVRMAEIIASSWGNLRVATRIIGNDGKTITAQAMCHDLETNVAVYKEVKRSIVDRTGRTYSQDMQVVTGNAAAAIAYRNAVLTVIPKAVTQKVIEEVKQVALGKSIDLETTRQRMIQYFAGLGVTQEQLFAYCGVKTIDEIDKQKVFELKGVANAIKEGTTTVKESFGSVIDQAKSTEKVSEAEKKVAQAMSANNDVNKVQSQQVQQ